MSFIRTDIIEKRSYILYSIYIERNVTTHTQLRTNASIQTSHFPIFHKCIESTIYIYMQLCGTLSTHIELAVLAFEVGGMVSLSTHIYTMGGYLFCTYVSIWLFQCECVIAKSE